MSAGTCPYCARHPDQGQGPTSDHVFVAALGGRARVKACRDCNSTIGSTVEGPLLKPGTFLNFAAQARGAGQPLPGTLPDGQVVTYDLRTHELRTVRPVATARDGDQLNIRLSGSPRQVRRLLAQQKITGPDADRLLAAADRPHTADDRITTTVVLDLPLADRLSAKIALGTGELAFGDAYTASPLGVQLRDILWDRTTPTEHLGHAAAATVDTVIADGGLRPELPAFAPGPDSQALFVPLAGRTGVLVHLAGSGLGAGGLVLDAPMPDGHELPVLVRDQPGGALVADTTAAVLRKVHTEDP